MRDGPVGRLATVTPAAAAFSLMSSHCVDDKISREGGSRPLRYRVAITRIALVIEASLCI